MRGRRLGAWALALSAAVPFLAACSDVEPSDPARPAPTTASATPTSSGAPSPGQPTASASAGPTSARPTPPSKTRVPTSSDQPLPKVERSEGPSSPTVSAKPTRIDGTVRYSDGLSLEVVSIDFGKETKEGPGNFPGREYAVLGLKVVNDSDRSLSMQTVVVAVLDKQNNQVAPVDTDEADVTDFSGTLRPGKSASARYAFAVPENSRSKVTVVVDFDGAHTSAVLRGELK